MYTVHTLCTAVACTLCTVNACAMCTVNACALCTVGACALCTDAAHCTVCTHVLFAVAIFALCSVHGGYDRSIMEKIKAALLARRSEAL